MPQGPSRRQLPGGVAGWRTILEEITAIGVLLVVLAGLAIFDSVVFPTVEDLAAANASSRETPAPGGGAETVAPPPSSGPAEPSEAEIRSAFDRAMGDVSALAAAEEFRRALDRFDGVSLAIRETALWRELAEPEIRRLEVLASAQDAYRDFAERVRRRIGAGDLAAALAVAERFPFRDTPYADALAALVAHAPAVGRPQDLLGPATALVVEPPATTATPTPGTTTPPATPPVPGANPAAPATPTPAAALVALPRWEGTPGAYWAVRSAFSIDLSTQAARALDFAERMHRRILGLPEEPPAAPAQAYIYDTAEDASHAPPDAALVVYRSGVNEVASLLDRVVVEGVTVLLKRDLGPAYDQAPAWVRVGIPLYLATNASDDGRHVVYTEGGDLRRDGYLREPSLDGARLAEVLAATNLDGPGATAAWATAFYLFQSDESRENGNDDRLARYLRRLRDSGGDGREPPDPYLARETPERLGVLAEHVRRFIVWGDVREYPIEEDDGWTFVFVPGLRIQTQMDRRFAQEVSFFFQGMFREYGRFYSELMGVPEKTIYQARLRLFATQAAFDDWNRRNGNAGMRPHWDPGANEVVMYNEGEFQENIPILYHEFSHRFSQVYLPGCTTWVNEGLASYMGDAQRKLRRYTYGSIPGWISEVRAALDAGTAVPLRDLTTLTYEEFHDSPQEGLHYAESCTLIHFIIHGNREIVPADLARRFFLGAAGGRCDWHALEALFGRPIDEIQALWEQHVRGYR